MEGERGSGLRQTLLLLLLEVLLLQRGEVTACVCAVGITSRAWETDEGSR